MATIIDFDYILYGEIHLAYDERDKFIGYEGHFFKEDGKLIVINYPDDEFASIQHVLTALSTDDWDVYAKDDGRWGAYYLKRYMSSHSKIPEVFGND